MLKTLGILTCYVDALLLFNLLVYSLTVAHTYVFIWVVSPIAFSYPLPLNPLLSSLPYFHAVLSVADGVEVTGFLESLA